MKKRIESKYYVPVRTLYGFLHFVNQTIITEIWCIYDKEGLYCKSNETELLVSHHVYSRNNHLNLLPSEIF